MTRAYGSTSTEYLQKESMCYMYNAVFVVKTFLQLRHDDSVDADEDDDNDDNF